VFIDIDEQRAGIRAIEGADRTVDGHREMGSLSMMRQRLSDTKAASPAKTGPSGASSEKSRYDRRYGDGSHVR
jgi:hypothetical protein